MTERVDAKAALEAMRNSAFCPGPWTEALQQTLADLEEAERVELAAAREWRSMATVEDKIILNDAARKHREDELAALKEKP